MKPENTNLGEQLINALKDYLDAGCPIVAPHPKPDNFSGKMGDEGIPMDPEHGDIFDPEHGDIFDPGKVFNPGDGINLKVSKNLYDSYGNKMNLLQKPCDLVKLLYWVLKYEDFTS